MYRRTFSSSEEICFVRIEGEVQQHVGQVRGPVPDVLPLLQAALQTQGQVQDQEGGVQGHDAEGEEPAGQRQEQGEGEKEDLNERLNKIA